jgi:Small Multidrug Resistance (SMR) protein
MSVFYLAAAILLEVCGTTALELSDGLSRLGPASVVVVCYTASFAVLSPALRGIDLRPLTPCGPGPAPRSSRQSACCGSASRPASGSSRRWY